MIVVAIALIGGGVTLVVLGLASRSDRLARNRLAGLRTRTTMVDDVAWYAGQRAGANFIILAGLVGIAGGVAALFFLEDDNILVGIVLSTSVLALLLVAIGGRRGQQAARKVLGE